MSKEVYLARVIKANDGWYAIDFPDLPVEIHVFRAEVTDEEHGNRNDDDKQERKSCV